MLITRLELVDFKSYQGATLGFAPGTNAIVGENGSGKSSLLEAIGLALFDSYEDTIASYVRESARDATILVRFISSYDEREYEVERRIGKGVARYRVLDVALGQNVIAEGAAEVSTWLHLHLRADPGANLPTLFRNTIGVPQGAITSAFLGTAAERKAIFDPLLQVSDYERAWSNLGATRSHLEERRNDQRVAIASLESQVARVPILTGERVALETALQALDGRIRELADELENAESELVTYNAQQAELRGLQQRSEGLHARCQSLEELLETAKQGLAESLQAEQRLQAARTGHEAYTAAEARLKLQEERRAGRDALVGQRAALDTQLARAATRLQQAVSGLSECAAAQQLLAELLPMVEQQTRLEEELSAAREEAHSLQDAQRRLAEATRELARARTALETISEALAGASEIEATLAESDHSLERLQRRRQGLVERQAACSADLRRLDEQTSALSAADSARCPVCEADLSSSHRQELLNRNTERRSELETLLASLLAEQRALASDEKAERAHRAAIEAQRRALPGEAEHSRAREEAERRTAALEQAQSDVELLADAPQRLQRAQAALQDLGDPRKQATEQRVLAERKPALERERDRASAEQTRLADALAALATQLHAYDDLDGLLEATRAQLGRHRADHETFLSNQRAAEQRPSREQRVEAGATELAAAESEWRTVHTDAEAARADYRADLHAEAQARVRTVGSDVAAARAQQQERAARLATVAAEIAQLESQQQDLAVQCAALQETEALSRLVARIRDLLRQAGPEITRQRVRRISVTASQLYADIMADNRNRLVWSQDYALTLEVKGQVRSFRQLSGGEQMAAALALRLALLRETSSIDIAFFDEPTAHLDPARRSNLAEQIMRVKGFQQLFVISHDDSFDALAQNHVRVYKDEQGSRVETD